MNKNTINRRGHVLFALVASLTGPASAALGGVVKKA
jgi:hypothetical protein